MKISLMAKLFMSETIKEQNNKGIIEEVLLHILQWILEKAPRGIYTTLVTLPTNKHHDIA